jgi:hypothetical protein
MVNRWHDRPSTTLQAYPDSLQQQVQKIIEGPGLAAWLQVSDIPEPHGIRTDGALYELRSWI